MMKVSARKHSTTRATSSRRAQQPAHLAHELRWMAAPDLFSDREDDAVEITALLRQLEDAHDDALGLDRYH